MQALLSNFSIRVKVIALIVLAVAGLIIAGSIGVQSTSAMAKLAGDMYSNQTKPIILIASANQYAIYANRSDYRFIAEPEKSAMDEVTANRAKQVAEMNRLLDEYRKSELTPQEVDLLKQFDAAWPTMEAACKQARDLSYADTGDGAGNTKALEVMRAECRPKFKIVDDLLSKLMETNQQLAEEAHKNAEASYASTRNQLITIAVVLTVLMFIFGLLVQQGIVGALARAAQSIKRVGQGDFSEQIQVVGNDEVATMMTFLSSMQGDLRSTIGHILNSAQTLASTAEELATATEQMSASVNQQVDATASAAASVEELTVSIANISNNAGYASENAVEAGSKADHGNNEVISATQLVKKVSERVVQTAAELETLSSSAQQIGSIATVIKDVADQTNLLALNAAIEAARAGDTGRGFAVVADEVRKLAERTTTSASEITNMIASIQRGVQTAQASMRQSCDAVTEVVSASERAAQTIEDVQVKAGVVVQAIGGIATSTGEQSHASNELAKRVEVVAQMSEENQATVVSVSQSAQDLASIAEQLQVSVARFKLA